MLRNVTQNQNRIAAARIIQARVRGNQERARQLRIQRHNQNMKKFLLLADNVLTVMTIVSLSTKLLLINEHSEKRIDTETYINKRMDLICLKGILNLILLAKFAHHLYQVGQARNNQQHRPHID